MVQHHHEQHVNTHSEKSSDCLSASMHLLAIGSICLCVCASESKYSSLHMLCVCVRVCVWFVRFKVLK